MGDELRHRRKPSHHIFVQVTNGKYVARRWEKQVQRRKDFDDLGAYLAENRKKRADDTRSESSSNESALAPEEEQEQLWKLRVQYIIRHPVFEQMTTLLTVVALYLADLRSLYFDRRADMAIDSILIATISAEMLRF